MGIFASHKRGRKRKFMHAFPLIFLCHLSFPQEKRNKNGNFSRHHNLISPLDSWFNASGQVGE
jgi:hypothetical protein